MKNKTISAQKAAITEPIIEPIITQKTDYKKLMAELVKEQKKADIKPRLTSRNNLNKQ